jgi:hypothetical protein
LELLQSVACDIFHRCNLAGGLAGGTFSLRGKTLVLLAVYYPVASDGGGRRQMTQHYATVLQSLLEPPDDQSDRETPMVFTGGDYNCTTAAPELLQVHTEFALSDAWGLVHEGPRPPTFRATVSNPHGSVIDHIFVSSDIAGEVVDALMLPPPRSDHDAVACAVRTPLRAAAGPGLFQLNPTFLRRPDTLAMFTDTLTAAMEAFPLGALPATGLTTSHFTDRGDEGADDARAVQQWWENLKAAQRELARTLGKAAAADRRDSAVELNTLYSSAVMEEARIVAEEAGAVGLGQEVVAELARLRARAADLRQASSTLAKDAADAARAENEADLFRHNGHLPSKALRQFRTKRRPYITCGFSREDRRALEKRFCSYWGKVFGDTRFGRRNLTGRQRRQAVQAMLGPTLRRTATCPTGRGPSGVVTPGDLLEALQALAPTAPGADGLPAGYHRAMQSADERYVLYFHAVVVAGMALGQLHPSARDAAILMLPKGGDKAEPAHYRPIALLNADYKILAKALQLRLTPWLTKAIHVDQTGFVAGRDIVTNLTLLRDAATVLQERADQTGVEEHAFLFVDFAKAYDSVEHDFLWRAMEGRGLSPEYIRWVQLLYAGAGARILLNGALSAPLEIGRGVRQGDPLSPGLFLLTVETLFDYLRDDADFHGIDLPLPHLPHGARHPETVPPPAPPWKVSAFADDLTVPMTDGDDVPVMRALDLFALASGLACNRQKSHLWVFSPVEVDPPQRAFAATQIPRLAASGEGSTVKVLGIRMGPGATPEDTWQPLVESIARRIHFWRHIPLTVRGRAVVANAVIVSTIAYAGAATYLPPVFADCLDRMVQAFVQRGAALYDPGIKTVAPGARSTTGLYSLADLWSPLHLGGMALRRPSLWATAGQQRVLLLLAREIATASAGGRVCLPAWTRPALAALELVLAPWGDRHTFLLQPGLRSSLARLPLAFRYWRQALEGWYELQFHHLFQSPPDCWAWPLWKTAGPDAFSPLQQSHQRNAFQLAQAGFRRVWDVVELDTGQLLSVEALRQCLNCSPAAARSYWTFLLDHAVPRRVLLALGGADLRDHSRRSTRGQHRMDVPAGMLLGGTGAEVLLVRPILARPPAGCAVASASAVPAFHPLVELELLVECFEVRTATRGDPEGLSFKFGAALCALHPVPAAVQGPSLLWGMHGRYRAPRPPTTAAASTSQDRYLGSALSFICDVLRQLHALLHLRPALSLTVTVSSKALWRMLQPFVGTGPRDACLSPLPGFITEWLELRALLVPFPTVLGRLVDHADALATLALRLPAWLQPFAGLSLANGPEVAMVPGDLHDHATLAAVLRLPQWPGADPDRSTAFRGDVLHFPPFANHVPVPVVVNEVIGSTPGCPHPRKGCCGLVYRVARADAVAPPAGSTGHWATCRCGLHPLACQPPAPLRPALFLLDSPVFGTLSLLGCGTGSARSSRSRTAGAQGSPGLGRVSVLYWHRLQANAHVAASLGEPWHARVRRAWLGEAQDARGAPASHLAVAQAISQRYATPLPLWDAPGPPDWADLQWRLALRKVPVYQRLVQRHVLEDTAVVSCAVCPTLATPEDELHAFVSCPQACAVWQAVTRFWSSFPALPAFPLSTAGSLLFGLPPSRLRGPAKTLWDEVGVVLLALGRRWVWHYREEAVRHLRPWAPDSVPRPWRLPTASRLVASLAADLTRFLQSRFFVLERPVFDETWGTSRLVGLPAAASSGQLRLPRLHCHLLGVITVSAGAASPPAADA